MNTCRITETFAYSNFNSIGNYIYLSFRVYMHKKRDFKRKVSVCQVINQTFCERLMHTPASLSACPRAPSKG